MVQEQASILVPGGSLLAAGMIILGDQSPIILAAMTVPQLAVYLILAYATGHLLQIFGTHIEGVCWKLHGGMPIDWVRQGGKGLLTEDQRLELARQVQAKLGLPLPAGLEGLSKGQWYFVTRQLLAYVQGVGQPQQLHHLTGNYELYRGIAASALALAAGIAIYDPVPMLAMTNLDLYYIVLALSAATLAAYQMERYAVQYALELFCQFIVAPGGVGADLVGRIPEAPPALVS